MKILIIGGGPAGASASIFLAKAGADVVIVDREPLLQNSQRIKVGESLPPNAQQLLQELDVWNDFTQQPHRKCLGNQSIWGSDAVTYRDFIHHPVGHGWHLDRMAFEKSLLKTAQDAGVSLLEETTILKANYKKKQWKVELKKQETIQNFTFDFLIDASGRSSWLSRQQGISKLYEDVQLALIAFLKLKKTPTEQTTLIEATTNGWWYSAFLPNRTMVTNFICQPDKHQRREWATKEGWQQLIQKGTHSQQRYQKYEGRFVLSPRFISADTYILEQLYGEGWLAIGDAAMAFDPIASHGISMGIVSARDASKAIVEHFSDQRKDAFSAYNALMWATFEGYRTQRKTLYLSEKRFFDKPYWKQRQLQRGR